MTSRHLFGTGHRSPRLQDIVEPRAFGSQGSCFFDEHPFSPPPDAVLVLDRFCRGRLQVPIHHSGSFSCLAVLVISGCWVKIGRLQRLGAAFSGASTKNTACGRSFSLGAAALSGSAEVHWWKGPRIPLRRNKKLLVTSASLLVTSALLAVTRSY